MNEANPFNFRTLTSARGDGLTDFRSRAVAESERTQRSRPGGLPPERSGLSACLEREPSLAKFRSAIKASAVGSAILALTGLAASGIILCLEKARVLPDDPHVLTIAARCCFGSMLFMLVPMWVERWIVRRHLSSREAVSDAERGGIHVALEYAPTCGAMKILAEDVGLIFLHPGAQYIKISGLSYDYVIQGKDLASLALHPNGKTVLLSYTIGNERLDLAIVPRSLLAEFKRQTLGSSRNLFESIEEALGAQGSRMALRSSP
jgi:hypothetical protein